jgi:hypothetical protein
MKWTAIPAGELNAAEQRLRVALGEDAGNVASRINADPLFARVLADQLKDIARQLDDKKYGSVNPNWQRAHKIMGENFFGVEEAMKYFGVNPSNQELVSLWRIPFPWTTLRELKDSHILVAEFPLTIVQIMDRVGSKLFDTNQSYYSRMSFANEPGWVSWHLIRKTAAPGSKSKTWEEQRKLLNKSDRVPATRQMVYAIIGYYLVANKKLFPTIRVRTSSRWYEWTDNSPHVEVGGYGLKAPAILSLNETDRLGLANIGLSSERMPKGY